MANTGMIRHGVVHIYRRSISVIENRERDSSRSNKEPMLKSGIYIQMWDWWFIEVYVQKCEDSINAHHHALSMRN
jgi:hypothetical protein